MNERKNPNQTHALNSEELQDRANEALPEQATTANTDEGHDPVTGAVTQANDAHDDEDPTNVTDTDTDADTESRARGN